MDYFHISETLMDVGKELAGRRVLILSKDVEELLDRHRPKDHPKRLDSVFMIDSKDATRTGVKYSKGYFHRLMPEGEVYKHNLDWIGSIQRQLDKEALLQKATSESYRKSIEKVIRPDQYVGIELETMAQNYWAAEVSGNTRFEYVCRKAIVVERDETPLFLDPLYQKIAEVMSKA